MFEVKLLSILTASHNDIQSTTAGKHQVGQTIEGLGGEGEHIATTAPEKGEVIRE